MRDDREDKPEDHEESEYHFSDDEANYEIETEAPKRAAAEGGASGENLLNKVTRSKRMLISLGVFVFLVFIVYRMVAPSSTTPQIAIAPTASQQNLNAGSPTAPVTPAANIVAQAPSAPATNPMLEAAAASRNAQAQQQSTVQMVQTPAPGDLMAQQPAPGQQLAQGALQQQPAPATTVPVQSLQQQQQQAMVQQQPAPPQTLPSQVQLPPVIAVDSASALSAQPSTSAENASQIVSQNEKMVGQLQAEYQQKINEFASQNKALQDELQTLSSRMAGMEGQMTQLVQTMLRQGPPQQQAVTQEVVEVQPVAVEVPRISFNVQAIIPGRAWLRSDSGETVTVAEGDLIKELGRVTKIDPYDGVVEINTGSKVISLSYGGGN